MMILLMSIGIVLTHNITLDQIVENLTFIEFKNISITNDIFS